MERLPIVSFIKEKKKVWEQGEVILLTCDKWALSITNDVGLRCVAYEHATRFKKCWGKKHYFIVLTTFLGKNVINEHLDYVIINKWVPYTFGWVQAKYKMYSNDAQRRNNNVSTRESRYWIYKK